MCAAIPQSSHSQRRGSRRSCPDAPQVNRKGALEGGFHDERKSALRSHQGMLEAQLELEKAKAHQDKLQKKTLELDQEVSHLMSSIQKMEAKRENLRGVATQAAQDLKANAAELARIEEHIAKLTEEQPSVQAEIDGLEAQVST